MCIDLKFMNFRLATDEEEVVLCTIQIDANGVLSIHPDFNRGRRAYVKETQKEFGKGELYIDSVNSYWR
jgi:hypothetical protein